MPPECGLRNIRCRNRTVVPPVFSRGCKHSNFCQEEGGARYSNNGFVHTDEFPCDWRFLLQVAHFLVQFAHCPLQVAHFVVQFAHCVLQVAYFVVKVALCLLQFAHCLLQVSHSHQQATLREALCFT